MDRVVLGVDDGVTGRIATDWVAERAGSRPTSVRVVAALDLDASSPDATRQLLAETARRIEQAAPGTPVESVVSDRPMLHELLKQSGSADLLVVGSRPDPAVRDGRTTSLPVSLAARAQCPVVIVPEDREPRDGAVVVGADADGTSFAAVRFAAREAAQADVELEIVHTWEPWAAPKTRTEQFEQEGALAAVVEQARAEFPSVRIRGVLREAVAHDGVLASARDARLVVLGTHGLGRETGMVLGAIHLEVMIRGKVALCVVPLGQASGSE